ncbi:MAG: sulfate transporter subunit, partial [Planctomycetes bacterium]|nr:sulfate transporter subunit [Planctomycetota bacterium]
MSLKTVSILVAVLVGVLVPAMAWAQVQILNVSYDPTRE